MALTVGGNRNAGDGVFVNTRTIVGVENLSGQYDADVTLKLFFEPVQKRDGSSFEPNMMLFGKYVRDAKGEVSAWGSAFKIERLLSRVGQWNKTVNPDGSIPDEALEALIGKQCVVLQYPTVKNGKKYMQNYQMIAAPVEWDANAKKEIPGADWVRSRFEADVAGGFVKDYTREQAPAAHAPVAEEAAF